MTVGDRIYDALSAVGDELDALALLTARAQRPPAEPWVLFGSTVLLLHGLRDAVGDIDVFASAGLWSALAASPEWERQQPDSQDPPFLQRFISGLKVHVFYAWTDRDPEVDATQCRRAAERVDGWPCTPLAIVRMHKQMSIAKHPGSEAHRKHIADVEAIDEHLSQEAMAS